MVKQYNVRPKRFKPFLQSSRVAEVDKNRDIVLPVVQLLLVKVLKRQNYKRIVRCLNLSLFGVIRPKIFLSPTKIKKNKTLL